MSDTYFKLRAGTRPKAVHILTENIHSTFLFRAALQVKDCNIPKSLVANADETGIHLVPAGNKTFAVKGSVQVPITGLGDKRQFTGTLLLPLIINDELDRPGGQIIFAGANHSNACHPKTAPPPGWIYSTSDNHWQDIETTKHFLNGLVFPFFEKRRAALGLPNSQWAQLIWDVWYTHINPEILALCKKNYVKVLIVPAGHTKDLQVLDRCANFVFKSNLKCEFRKWVQSEMMDQIDRGVSSAAAAVSTKKSVLKEQLPGWVDSAWRAIPVEQFEKGWKAVEFEKCWDVEFQEKAESERERLYPTKSDPKPAVTEKIIPCDYYEAEAPTIAQSNNTVLKINKRKLTSTPKKTPTKKPKKKAVEEDRGDFEGWKEIARKKNQQDEDREKLVGKMVKIRFDDLQEEFVGEIVEYHRHVELFTVHFDWDDTTDDFPYHELIFL